jgi:hypothetical protein
MIWGKKWLDSAQRRPKKNLRFSILDFRLKRCF